MLSLPEMLFNQSRLTVVHEASGLVFDFNALDALKGWKQEALPPLQVSVATVRAGFSACQHMAWPLCVRHQV